jgi:hemoglobin
MAGSIDSSQPVADDLPATVKIQHWSSRRGPATLRRLIDAFCDRVERDDLIGPFFPVGMGEDHQAHVCAWWIEVLSGAADSTRWHGSNESTLAHRRGPAGRQDLPLRFGHAP